MTQDTSLSSDDKKNLRGRHPLYSRLSGDVVWGFFEEQGYDAEACGQAMDDFIARMHEILAAMDALEKNTASCFSLHPDTVQCQQCGAFSGKVISNSTPQWRRFLPPFAVGCTVRCVLEDENYSGEEMSLGSVPHPVQAPSCPLLCPLLP